MANTPNKVKKKLKLKLNSVDRIEELIQESYDEICKSIEEVQREITKLSSSVNLNEEIMDGKAKYAKAMNDFITNKNKAITEKMNIAKLMSEILKYNGNVEKMADESEDISNWMDFIEAKERSTNNDEPIVYKP